MSILYPPIVDTYMPAFTKAQDCIITFSIPSLNNIKEISRYMVISIVDQRTNQSVLPHGIIIARTEEENQNQIRIKLDDLKENPEDTEDIIKINTFYKVQLKFIKNGSIDMSKEINLDTWLTENNQYCSEWSTVCLIKRILSPAINLLGFPEKNDNNLYTPTIWSNMNGIFSGSISFGEPEQTEEETETLKSFRIKAYKNKQLVMDSGEQYTSGNRNPNEFQYISNYNFQDGETYSLSITFTTQYDYTENQDYYFTLMQSYYSNMPTIDWNIQSEEDLGRMKVEMNSNSDEFFIGNFVIRRTSNKSNYSFWEDVHFGTYVGEGFHYIWYDYTIENGYFYKYCVQKLTKNNNNLITRSKGLIENTGGVETVHLASFNSTYLVGDEIQLNIKYNTQISSLSKIVQESKIETLGSKYPFIRKNGNIAYKEFSLSGLITLYMDELNEPLFNISDSTKKTKLENYNSTHTFASYNNVFQFSSNEEDSEKSCLLNYNKKNNISKQNDVIYEQKFRDKVLNFLQNNQVKLFKSPTEGNILVKLMNITLEPVDGLNRHLYNFSCTATEIDDFNLLNCDKYNIQRIGKYKDVDLQTKKLKSFFTQEIGYFKTSEDICTRIGNKFLYKSTENMQNNFLYLNYIRIEFESAPQLIYIRNGNPFLYTNNSKKFYPNVKPFLGHIININGNDIVVDERGIFEIGGDDVNIISLSIYNATALINCNVIVEEEIRKQKTKSIQWLESNIGQLERDFIPSKTPENTKDNLIKHLINKYYFDNGKTYQRISAINELTIEADPGTICYIKDFNEKKFSRHIIGSTGILSVFDELVGPFDNQNKLVQDVCFGGLHFNKFSPSQKDIVALYNGYIDYNEYAKYIDKNITDTIYFSSFDKISTLIPNGVYLIGNKDSYQRYIYYNSQWYIINEKDDILLDKIHAIITYVYIKEKGVYNEDE